MTKLHGRGQLIGQAFSREEGRAVVPVTVAREINVRNSLKHNVQVTAKK